MKILFIIIGLLSYLLIGMMSTVYANGPTLDDKLRNMDAAMDHYVNVCWKETYKSTCLDDLEDTWWMECSEWYDKLDTCKNGKVEELLKAHGRPT